MSATEPSASPAPACARPQRGRRALLLAACVALGVAIGAVGEHLTGDARWFLAVPACIAVAWLFVGDPNQCRPPPQ